MARIQTPLKGITTTSVYEDGDCYSLVNLREKNGALKPVSPRKVMQTLSRHYERIFVHQNSGYENWIGICKESNAQGIYYSVYYDILDEPKFISSVSKEVTGIEQIGNTLSIVTEDRISYLLYKNEEYISLGALPSIPLIRFGQNKTYTYRRNFKDEGYDFEQISTQNTEFLKNSIKGMVFKFMEEINEQSYTENGKTGLKLFDAHFVRWAFRLYDGTLTKHSPPILLMPEQNILALKKFDYKFGGDYLNPEWSFVEVNGYTLSMDYDFSVDEKWKDIIKSVDLFISSPLGLSNIENIRSDFYMPDNEQVEINLIKEITADLVETAKDCSLYYLVRSIDLESSSGKETFPSEKFTISKMDDLPHQETMSDDHFSQHTYGANLTYAYNNRLHLAGVNTTFLMDLRIVSFNGIDLTTEYRKSHAPMEKWQLRWNW